MSIFYDYKTDRYTDTDYEHPKEVHQNSLDEDCAMFRATTKDDPPFKPYTPPAPLKSDFEDDPLLDAKIKYDLENYY